MVKILFLIHDLGQGGAEKVLVNLVNNMDTTKFDISVTALFGGGVNEQFLAPHVHYRTVFPKSFPGNSHLMKLLSPRQLHRLCVRERYDIEVSYLEGPSARVISGCDAPDTKLVCWIHSMFRNKKGAFGSFRSRDEAQWCYDRFHRIIAVSQFVRGDFCDYLQYTKDCDVLYNTVESGKILALAEEPVSEIPDDGKYHLVAVGTLKPSKGYERLLSVIGRLKKDGVPVCLYILGIGPQEQKLKEYVQANGLTESVVFLGYETNPYRYVAKCDLFVCASFAEGFSTAATEALIVGTPVCTVEVSGMKEMLGENNEWGIVTESSEDALYEGIRDLLDHPEKLAHYKEKAAQRGKWFSTEETVRAVEEMLLSL